MKILVVVDMQNDFIDGSLGTAEAQAIVDNVVKKIKEFDGEQVCLTMDTHQVNYLDTQEGRMLPVEHCISNTQGWRINNAVESAIYDFTVTAGKEISIFQRERLALLCWAIT